MSRRVVVTGISAITSLGCEVSEFWDCLCAGKSGIGPVRRFDCSDFTVRFGGEISDFDPGEHVDMAPKDLRRMDRFGHFAVAGATYAIRQSGVDFRAMDPFRCGVLIGTGIGGLGEIESQRDRMLDRGPTRVSAFMIPKLMANAATGNVSVHWGLRGPSSSIATACASATNAIGDASRLIAYGNADVMVTGGSEAAMTPMGLAGFARMKALSTRNEAPQAASRPFDRYRDGFVLSEGAGIIVLEEYEFARKRGANILAEVFGYGMSSDGMHMTAPDIKGAGAVRAMQNAMNDANCNPDEIDYINAHGTSTPLGDAAEVAAIQTVFGPYAQKLAISSTKSQIGHMLGASGGVEFAVCVMALQHNVVPPTLNMDEPDDGVDLDFVPYEARPKKLRRILKNSFGFGGHNACLVLGTPD